MSTLSMMPLHRALRICLGIGIGILIFVIIVKLPVVRAIPQHAGVSVRPVLGWFLKLKTSIARSARRPLRGDDLEREAVALRSRVSALVAENTHLAELRRENAELRRELHFLEQTNYPLASARIIGRLKEGGSTFFILNRGSDAGLTIGLPVIVDGVLVAKLTNVHKAVSVAIPLTAPGVKTGATLAGLEKNVGIVEGELNVNLVMRLIPKDIEVAPGMHVITSGLETAIPRGLPIGTVERVDSGPQDLFQTAYLRGPLRAEDLEIVSIIKEINQPASF